jgi:hypothetical protein
VLLHLIVPCGQGLSYCFSLDANPMILYDTTADVSQVDIGNPLRYLLDSVKKSLHQNKIRV